MDEVDVLDYGEDGGGVAEMTTDASAANSGHGEVDLYADLADVTEVSENQVRVFPSFACSVRFGLNQPASPIRSPTSSFSSEQMLPQPAIKSSRDKWHSSKKRYVINCADFPTDLQIA